MAQDRNHSRFDTTKMTDRQKKSFKLMYENPEYPTSDIAKRFAMSTNTVSNVAHELGLKIRPNRGKA